MSAFFPASFRALESASRDFFSAAYCDVDSCPASRIASIFAVVSAMDLRRASADFSQSSRLFWYCAACCGSSSTSAMNLTISFFIPAIYRIFHESSQTAGAGKGQKIHTFRPEIVPSMARIIRAGMTLFSQRRTPPTRYPYTCRL